MKDLLLLFEQAKDQQEKQFKIKIVDEHIFLDVLAKDNHFWSPHLHLEVVLDEDEKVEILFDFLEGEQHV